MKTTDLLPVACKCCTLPANLNQAGFCDECKTCIHCEARPSAHELGLCDHCTRLSGVLKLYARTHHWTPEWEFHLRAKARHYQEELSKREVSCNAVRCRESVA
jgi:hypothetical protein